MQGLVTVLGLVFLASACASGPAAPERSDAAATDAATPGPAAPIVAHAAVPAGDLRAPEVAYAFCIYHARPDFDVAAEIRALALPGVTLVADLDALRAATGPAALIVSSPTSELPPPPTESLRFLSLGLDDADAVALGRATVATSFLMRSPRADAMRLYAWALAVAGATAEAVGGLVWDDAVRLVLSREAWLVRLRDLRAGGLDATLHVNVHVYQDGRMLRMITLGMEKFGLPDLMVSQVPKSATKMPWLLNAVAQTLLEAPRIARSGALELSLDRIANRSFRATIDPMTAEGSARAATLAVAWGEHDEGDADNRLVEVVWPGSPGALQEREYATLKQVFGASEQVVGAVHDDPALAAASARAKIEVRAIAPRFELGPPEGESLSVKAPFTTSDGDSEWMWVEVLTWSGDDIAGILRNEPLAVPGLHAGARVTVAADKVFDYLHVRADGSHAGGETDAILERRGD
ncbi:MAG: DUF2314 domain-containing protein [Myxococcota bacterium]